MKFKYINGKEGNTEDFNDIDADLIENCTNFLNVAVKYKVPFILRWYNPNNKTFSGASNFNNGDGDFLRVMASLNYCLQHECGNKYRIVKVEEDNTENGYEDKGY